MTAPTRWRLGLTGGIGSGKSTVSQMLVDLGAHLVDTDAISRALTAPGGQHHGLRIKSERHAPDIAMPGGAHGTAPSGP